MLRLLENLKNGSTVLYFTNTQHPHPIHALPLTLPCPHPSLTSFLTKPFFLPPSSPLSSYLILTHPIPLLHILPLSYRTPHFPLSSSYPQFHRQLFLLFPLFPVLFVSSLPFFHLPGHISLKPYLLPSSYLILVTHCRFFPFFID